MFLFLYEVCDSKTASSIFTMYRIMKYQLHGDMSVPTASSLSELSSLHDGGNTDFRHTYQTVQMKALPPIADLDDQSVLRAAPPTQSRRHRRDRVSHSDDELDSRYNYYRY